MDGKGAFADEPEMSCKLPLVRSAEERMAEAPEALLISTTRCDGEDWQKVLQKTGGTWGGRPVYMAEDFAFRCRYEKKKSSWVVSWKSPEGSEVSYPTEAYSPHKCLWNSMEIVPTEPPALVSKEEQRKEEEEELLLKEERRKGLWVDPAFPHSEASIIPTPCRVIWCPLREKIQDPVIFDEENPFDFQQGNIKNCWLIGQLGAMGEFPGHVKELFKAHENLIPADGKYSVCLYEIETNEWKSQEVDEYIPCDYHTRVAQYAEPIGSSIWGPILEKVVAKRFHSYMELSCGSASGAGEGCRVMSMLTGALEFAWIHRTGEKYLWSLQFEKPVTAESDPNSTKKGKLSAYFQVWEEERIGHRMRYTAAPFTLRRPNFEKGTEEGWIDTRHRFSDGSSMSNLISQSQPGWRYSRIKFAPGKAWDHGGYTGLEEVQLNKPEECQEFIFQKLLEFQEADYLITCSVPKKRNEREEVEDGLRANHCYSFLKAVRVGDFRMVCLRNPWGMWEWKGAWADESEEWKEHPEVAEALGISARDDGIFWMQIEDFLMNFTGISVALKSLSR